MKRLIVFSIALLGPIACSKKEATPKPATWTAQTGRQFYDLQRHAMRAKDVDLFWASFSRRNRREAEDLARKDIELARRDPRQEPRILLRYGLERRHLDLRPEDFVRRAMRRWLASPQATDETKWAAFVSEKREGANVIVALDHPKKGREELILVREDGALRYDGSRRDEFVAPLQLPADRKRTSLVPAGARLVRPKKVVDGDTIHLETGEKIRYIGVDTPEWKRGKPEPFYEEAKELNRSLLEGAEVYLETDVEKTDRYGRLLAYVWVKKEGREVMINAELLRKGMAYVYTFPPNLRHVETFVACQKEARTKGRGFWKDYKIGGETVFLGAARGRTFHRPSCRSVSKRKDLKRFKDQAEALDLGRSPCRNCKP